jgi:hypothetical protein
LLDGRPITFEGEARFGVRPENSAAICLRSDGQFPDNRPKGGISDVECREKQLPSRIVASDGAATHDCRFVLS